MSTSTLIDALGGTTAVARALHRPTSTVQSWKRADAIPSWHRLQVAQLAAAKDVPLPSGFLAATEPFSTPAPAAGEQS